MLPFRIIRTGAFSAERNTCSADIYERKMHTARNSHFDSQIVFEGMEIIICQWYETEKGKMLAKYRMICYDNSVPQLGDGVFFEKEGKI